MRRKNAYFRRFRVFNFALYFKSKTSDSFCLLQIFMVSFRLSMGKVKPFIEFQIKTPHVLMSMDTSQNKYILLQHGNILSICFW